MTKTRQNSLAEQLNSLLKETNRQDISVRALMGKLAGKGQAAILILLILPFCQPILIPGMSTLFGILIAFIGLRMAFGNRKWIPKMILDKKIPFNILEKISKLAITITEKLRFLTSTRLVGIVQNQSLHILHGLTITSLAIILALPLPIPFTNLLSAYPILAFGLGILEDDGLMIIIGYFLSLICFTFFFLLIFFGNKLLFFNS